MKAEPLSFMWANEVQSWELVFEVVQQCVCWGWVGSRLSRLGCRRSATRRVGLTAQAFVLHERCSHRYAALLWSAGQLNHSQVTHSCDYEAHSCAQEDMILSLGTKPVHQGSCPSLLLFSSFGVVGRTNLCVAQGVMKYFGPCIFATSSRMSSFLLWRVYS